MLIVDLIAGACIAGLAAFGLRAGSARMLPVAAFAAGAVGGALAAPLVLKEGQDSSFALALAFPAALVAGALAAAIVERLIGRPRRRRARARVPAMDAVGGMVLAAGAGVVAVWLIGAAVVQIASLRDRVEGSEIVGRLDSLVTPPGPGATPKKLPIDLFPIIAGNGPLIAPENHDAVRDPDVLRADRSVVRIETSRCGGGGLGSGWIAADGIVVTNAHVTAAAKDIVVRLRGTGPRLRATPIWFEVRNDISLLRVPGLAGVPALALVPSPKAGTSGATIGFPLGRHAIRGARIGATTSLSRAKIGGPKPAGAPATLKGRLVTPFRGRVAPGSSGGALVDTGGRVLATVFGGRLDRGSGSGVPNRFVRAALRRAGPPVSTGPCAEHS